MQSFSDQANPPPLKYGCVCSGVSVPTLAAKRLGWKTKFFSEIEKFPRAVLAHRYPQIPLHGDFTTIQKDTYGTVDLLVGGTPCQSFSVAGKRLGLDDPRGNLALEFGALAARLHALWLAFENVPGLLSSAKGEDFAALISAFTGIEYRPPATGWKNAGIVEGHADRWGVAWRILDAQYFGVAQRRRRLFVIGYRGDWRPAAAVLLEPDSMRGDSPPSRQTQKGVAALTATGVGTCGADDNQAQAGHLIPYNIIGSAQKGKNHAYKAETSGCVQHKGLAATGNESGTLIAGTIEAAGGRSRGAGINPGRLVCADVAETMRAGGNLTGGHRPPGTDVDTASTYLLAQTLTPTLTKNHYGDLEGREALLVAHTLRGDGFDASEDGTGRGTPLIPVAYRIAGDGCVFEEGNTTAPLTTATDPCANILAFSGKDDGRDVTLDLSPTLRSVNHDGSHANGGGQVAIAYPILEPGSRTGVSTTDPRAGSGIGEDGDPMYTLQAGKTHGIAVSLRGREGGATADLSGDTMPALRASQGGGDKPHVLLPSAVRRLTPEECELLQGMPTGYTRIPWRNKPSEVCPDGPRYKSIGNSMAVPCVRWIFDRLDHVHRILLQMEKAA
jgi:DNA (cytosine-5)-methyltransferase 1